MDDEAGLVERCIEGDEAAWDRFVEEYGSVAEHVATKRLRMRGVAPTPQVVRDICAEVFRSFLAKDGKLLRTYDPRYALSTWVGVITRTRVNRHLRSLNRTPGKAEDLGVDIDAEFDAGGDSPLETLSARDVRRAVREVVGEMKERDQRVLELFYWKDRSYDEIAEALGISKNSVGSALSRARARLEKMIEARKGDFL